MNTVNIGERIGEMVEIPVGQLVATGPHRAAILEKWGLDYCCGGKRTLAEACRERSLSADDVARELLGADTAREAAGETIAPETDWNSAPLSDLCDHIERAHHDYLRANLPRIATLTMKVAAAHGSTDERLQALHALFLQFQNEMENHTLKEDRIVFPWIRVQEKQSGTLGNIAVPIEVLRAEHDDAGEALRVMRVLTDNYTVPVTACNTYRALIAALVELEADMHQHVHKENNILFPRALENWKQQDLRNKTATA